MVRMQGSFLSRLLWSRYYMPVSLAVTALLLVGIGLAVFARGGAGPLSFLGPRPTVAITGPGANVAAQRIEAYVLGAVQHPGVYALPSGAHAHDLIAAAGGLLDDADTTGVNLAMGLVDGQWVYVPHRGEQVPLELGGKVNINAANAEQLHNALGISLTIARKIVAYRLDHGPFTAVSQLLLVPISQTTYNDIKDIVTV